MAIMAVREGLAFDTTIESDTACLAPLVAGLRVGVGAAVRVLRDPTRGGVASCSTRSPRRPGSAAPRGTLPVPTP
jgi:hydrogenase expression/formation protein HypE